MNSRAATKSADPYIQRLKDARNKNAVLKYRLAMFRSSNSSVPVVAFEGPEDKIVYYHWFKRIRPDFIYEPFPCSGKKQVLKFREMLSRDLTNLKDQVYFFIDRDFDDFAGYPDGDDLFMTDNYATENYLVCDGVLTELLTNEFHCHARPEVRESIRFNFAKIYEEFLQGMHEINFRMFAAKKLSVELSAHVPQRINEFATVAIDSVDTSVAKPEKLIVLSTEPSDAEWQEARTEFNQRDRRTRHRGKFALAFFERWLSLLADDYEKASSTFFSGIDRSAKVLRNEIGLGNLASKAPFPNGLAEFVGAMAQPA